MSHAYCVVLRNSAQCCSFNVLPAVPSKPTLPPVPVKQVSAGQVQPSAVEVFLRMGSALDIAAVRRKPKDWLPDACWLNVVALSEGLDAFRDLPDSLARSDAAWRAWCGGEGRGWLASCRLEARGAACITPSACASIATGRRRC